MFAKPYPTFGYITGITFDASLALSSLPSFSSKALDLAAVNWVSVPLGETKRPERLSEPSVVAPVILYVLSPLSVANDIINQLLSYAILEASFIVSCFTSIEGFETSPVIDITYILPCTFKL